jgi:DNA photolyase
MDTAIAVFTRDLRLHDNPALHQACARARLVVPLFVVDPALGARSANRARFLADDVSHYATARRHRLERELAGLDPPGSIRPGSCPPPSGSGWAIQARWWSWPDRTFSQVRAFLTN